MEFYLDLIHAIEFVISPVPYITALKVFMKSFKGVCLWDSLFVSGLNQCRTWNCFACYGIFSEVGTAILAGSVPGMGSSKVLVLDTWYLMQNLEYLQCSKLSQKSYQSSCLESQIINIKLKKILKKVPGPPPKLSASGRRTGSNLEHWYLVLTCTWHFEIQKYLVLTCTWRQSTWYLSKYFQVLLSNQHVYSGLNLEYVSFNKSPLNTIMMNYWNGSYFVLTAWGLQTSRLDCLPWFAGQEYLKSLAHGWWGCDLKLSIFTFISRIDILGISCDTIFPSVEGHKTSLIIGEHWFR